MPGVRLYLGLSAAALILAVVATRVGTGAPFARYFGHLPPLAVFAGVSIAGGFALTALGKHGFRLCAAGRQRGLGIAMVAGVLFGAAIVLVDRTVVFPVDLNVAFPTSLCFYPAIGWIAELVFHVLPLALVLGALARVRVGRRRGLRLLAIVAVAAIEPAFQAAFGTVAAHSPRAAATYVAGHVFAFNLVQLELFRRYDFVAMFALRLTYYGIWHVGWGHARLQLLFG